jgi:anti-sigma regulatory factor (Ser/Thr protein kinase)
MKPEFQYSYKISSTLDNVDDLIDDLFALLDSKYEKYNRFALNLVLRETLNNAVIHGNKFQEELSVSLELLIHSRTVYVTVEDEGEGFDWPSIINSPTISKNDHGRGFPILSDYCQNIRLNNRGNQIHCELNLMEQDSA